MIGTKLAHYEITSHLGSGGMGEVYQATDSKLGRNVAIKLLPEAFAGDSERVARFEREARVLASLTHPHIAAIYGLEQAGGRQFLVMELVGGETLAERIKRSRMPLEEALAIAKQIADALEAAHEKTVVHRDLKPANVKITPDGKVKVLDFGLAKMLEPPPGSRHLVSGEDGFSNSPTLLSVTMAGVILGTASYMSPEQARGQAADMQSDIWAFGCVLYEMLTGDQTFGGETLTDVLGGIVRAEPNWSALPSATPPLVRLLLRQCLQKQRNVRLHHIGDAKLQLDAALSEQSVIAAAPDVTQRLRWLWLAVAGLLLLVVAGLASYIAGYFRLDSKDIASVRFSVPPPLKTSFNFAGGVNAPYVSISPNGRQLAFIAASEGVGSTIWIRPLDSLEARPLPGTQGVAPFPPFWSPDSQFIGFAQEGKLRKIKVSGGPAQTLCDAPDFRAGTWSRNGVIIFDGSELGPLMRVSQAGGKVEPATVLDAARRERGHAWPYFLPDSDHFLFLALSSEPENDAILAGSLSSNGAKFVINARSRLAYDRGGFLLFVRERSLMAQPFDSVKLQVTGDPVPIAERVRYNASPGAEGQASLAVSDNGALAYRAGSDEGTVRLTWVDRSGTILGTPGPVSSFRNPELSHDDGRIAVEQTDSQANIDVVTVEVRRSVNTRVTSDPSVDILPLWSPDGTQIVFERNNDLYIKPSNGAGAEQLILKNAVRVWDWSSDGKFVIYSPSPQEIWVLPLFGERKPYLYFKSEFTKTNAQLSPDRRWLAYQSNESGGVEVYVQSFPIPSVKVGISTSGGASPRWRGDGKELFYISGQMLMSVAVRPKGTVLEPSAPVSLFEMVRVGGTGGVTRQPYDVTADGQRFLLNAVDTAGPSDSPLTVVLNWAAGLKK